MIRTFLFAAAFAAACSLSAQNANPLTSEARQAYNSVKNNLLKAADKMPEENYSFRATPEVRPFGQLIAHVADSQTRLCAAIKGEQKTSNAASKTTKADLVAALKASFDYCDSAFESVTDATATQMVTIFRGQRSKLGGMYFVVAHNNEMYGTIAVYMRLKGLVPPSSEQQRP